MLHSKDRHLSTPAERQPTYSPNPSVQVKKVLVTTMKSSRKTTAEKPLPLNTNLQLELFDQNEKTEERGWILSYHQLSIPDPPPNSCSHTSSRDARWEQHPAGTQRVKAQISSCHQQPWMSPKSPCWYLGACLCLWGGALLTTGQPRLHSCTLSDSRRALAAKRCLLQGQGRLALEISLLRRNEEPLRAWHRQVFCWRCLGAR